MKIINSELLKSNIEKRVDSDIHEGKIGGAYIIVAQSGKVIYRNSFSEKNLGIDISENSMFRLASMTKPITAAAILILVQRGKISLDDTVEKYLPEFTDMEVGELTDDGNITVKCKSPFKIKVLHLLTHSSGLGSGTIGDIQCSQNKDKCNKDLKTAVEFYSNMLLDFIPGTTTAYSGVCAFDVLARIVEIVSGCSFDEFLKKEIFDPLEMNDTTFTPSAEQWSRFVPMFNRINEHPTTVSMPKNCVFESFPTERFSGGAGLAGIPDDYFHFATMLLNKGEYNGRRILDEKMVNEMSKRHVDKSIGNWGLGVRVIEDGKDKNLPDGCFGWSGAYGTHFWVDPINEITALYFKNAKYDGGSGALTALHFEEDVYMAVQ